jgi:hypothetical protein
MTSISGDKLAPLSGYHSQLERGNLVEKQRIWDTLHQDTIHDTEDISYDAGTWMAMVMRFSPFPHKSASTG